MKKNPTLLRNSCVKSSFRTKKPKLGQSVAKETQKTLVFSKELAQKKKKVKAKNKTGSAELSHSRDKL